MSSAKKIFIAANPRSGATDRRALVDALRDRLIGLGFDCDVLTNLDQFAEQTSAATKSGTLHCVVAAGGDGTVSAIAERTTADTPIALFPLGTENLFARQLGIPPSISMVADMIAAGNVTQMDAASANGSLFSLMIGVGFDAEIVKSVHLSRRGHITKARYAWPLLKTTAFYRYPPIHLEFNGFRLDPHMSEFSNVEMTPHRIESRWVFLVNLPRYAGELSFSPTADPTDGLIDVCCFAKGGLFRGIRYLVKLWQDRIRTSKHFSIYRTHSVKVTSDTPLSFQTDGDHGGSLPLDVSILPNRLKLLVPYRTTASVSSTDLSSAGLPDDAPVLPQSSTAFKPRRI
jgi:diacylglycerol kinase family enzyme